MVGTGPKSSCRHPCDLYGIAQLKALVTVIYRYRPQWSMATFREINFSGAVDMQRGLIGGALLSLSTVTLLVSTGKAPGISGILSNVLAAKNAAHWGWRRSFLAGLFFSGLLISWTSNSEISVCQHLVPSASFLAGGLTGVGTRMAGGCTSGHGIFGMSRLSLRSLAAVCTFLFTGMLAATFCARPDVLAVLTTTRSQPPASDFTSLLHTAGPTLAASLYAMTVFRTRWSTGTGCSGLTSESLPLRLAAFLCATLFGWGLHISGLTDPARIKGFLNPWAQPGWDITLLAVMGSAVALTSLSFAFLSTVHARPLLWRYAGTIEPVGTISSNIDMAPRMKIRGILDVDLLLGSALFGLGWGISGVCPGPAIVSFAGLDPVASWVLPGIMVGMVTYEYFFGKPADCLVCSFEHMMVPSSGLSQPVITTVPLYPPPPPDTGTVLEVTPATGRKAGRTPKRRSPAGYRARSTSRSGRVR